MRCIRTEIFRHIVLLYNKIIHSTYRLHKVSQPPSIVRRRLIYELIINKRPDPFILMHMRTNIKIH
jgi:hypothetical protein